MKGEEKEKVKGKVKDGGEEKKLREKTNKM